MYEIVINKNTIPYIIKLFDLFELDLLKNVKSKHYKIDIPKYSSWTKQYRGDDYDKYKEIYFNNQNCHRRITLEFIDYIPEDVNQKHYHVIVNLFIVTFENDEDSQGRLIKCKNIQIVINNIKYRMIIDTSDCMDDLHLHDKDYGKESDNLSQMTFDELYEFLENEL